MQPAAPDILLAVLQQMCCMLINDWNCGMDSQQVCCSVLCRELGQKEASRQIRSCVLIKTRMSTEAVAAVSDASVQPGFCVKCSA